MKYLTATLSLVFGLFLSTQVSACVCEPPSSISKAFKESEAVFNGKYVGGEYRKGIKSEGTEMHLETMGQPFDYEVLVLKFEVDEWFKGQQKMISTVELVTSNARLPDGTQIVSDCDLGFEKGKAYLVYAYADDNKNLNSGACTRTKGLKRAAAEIQELRKLGRNGQGSLSYVQPFSFLNLFNTISLRSFGRWSMNSFPSQWSVSCMNARAA